MDMHSAHAADTLVSANGIPITVSAAGRYIAISLMNTAFLPFIILSAINVSLTTLLSGN